MTHAFAYQSDSVVTTLKVAGCRCSRILPVLDEGARLQQYVGGVPGS